MQGQELELELERGQEQEQGCGQGGGGTEEAHLQVLWEVLEVGQRNVEGQVVAEVVVQAWGSLAGIQQGGSKEAAEASHSPLEAVQNLEEEEEGNRSSQLRNNKSVIPNQVISQTQPVLLYLVVLASLCSFD